MTQNVTDLVKRYLAIWNQTQPAARRAAIEALYENECTYTDPIADVRGHDGIDAMIAAVQKAYPGIVFELDGAVDGHHDQARFTWSAGLPGAPAAVVGFDVAVFRDGRIRHVFGFLDKAPA